MKKLNLIIGKRQIMISTLLLILAIAAYLNWLAAGEQSVSVMDAVNPKKTESAITQNDSDSESNYGEAELVSTQTTPNTDNYFSQTKLQKTRTRDDISEKLIEFINLKSTSEEKKQEAESKVLKLNEISEKETQIENQVRNTQGFSDCIATISIEGDNTTLKENKDNKTNKATSVQVAVKTQDMTDEQANKIKDIVKKVENVDPTNIVVIPIR